ncbi:MAG: DUF1080 domain-containing protein [Pirellula sp.]|jgi:hypothetical protein|nr:DUF1080 domain-containing protein [Pirellula sp.]
MHDPSLPKCFLSSLLLAAMLSVMPGGVISQASAQDAQVELEEGYVWLFDGKSLDGWEGNQDWFRVENGAIVAGALTKEIPHNEFLATTKEYGNFELKLEARLKGSGDNAGVQFRSSRIPDSTEVSGYQCDIGSAWGRPVWGGLYDESRRNRMLAEGDPKKVAEALKSGEWNQLMVRAVDGHVQIWLNGSLTIDYTEVDSKIAKRGIIALQIHSGPPTEAWYRNIRIRELPSSR